MSQIKALTFDVFGTVVDPKGSLVAECVRLLPDVQLDWGKFAEDWIDQYGQRVGALDHWRPLDSLLVDGFYAVAATRPELDDMPGPAAMELSTAWTRLKPWPDAVAGFAAMSGSVKMYAMTNANRRMLARLARHTGLPWSGLLSGEDAKAYKPDDAVYRTAITTLNLQPGEICMVAAHCFDLNAAKRHGYKTALIAREGERGSNVIELDHVADWVAPDIHAFSRAFLADNKG